MMGKIDVSKAIELYESGMSQKEVADKLDVSQVAISNAFRKLGYVSREKVPRFSQKGTNNPNWKGGKSSNNGYIVVYCPEHHRARNSYVFEHILVMENHLGRKLNFYGIGHSDNEVVHHINGDRTDNKIENLSVMRHVDHMAEHSKERLSKPVRRLDTGKVYPSAKEASISLGLSQHAVKGAIRQKTKAKGTYWEWV
jgi:HNH endonuclease